MIDLQQDNQSMRTHTLTGHSDGVKSVLICPDGQTLISGGEDGTIKLWQLQTGELIRTLTGHTYGVKSLAICPDGQTLVSGGGDGTIKLWKLPTAELIRTLIAILFVHRAGCRW